MRRILILSDIHALSRDLTKSYAGRTGGKLYVEDRTADKNSLLAVADALNSQKGQIDLLLCLGDLAHQAKLSVTMCVWHDIQRVAQLLEIPSVAAVTGNHDIASRSEDFKNEIPSDFLRHIYPMFPIDLPVVSDEYRLNSHAVTTIGDMSLVLIDTCSLHGYGGINADKIYNTGHLSAASVNSIIQKIGTAGARFYMVAMHHHPKRVDELKDPDYDQVVGGEYLLSELGKLPIPGIVVHGHKHMVKLRKSNEASNSPWILSASSLAANAYENMESYFSNQFHLIDIERPANMDFVRGKLRSWEWAANHWVKSENEVMRHEVGFGAQMGVKDVASAITGIVTSGFVSASEASVVVPDLPYLTSSAISDLRDELAKSKIQLLSEGLTPLAGFFRSGE